jgi:hypothetical protein
LEGPDWYSLYTTFVVPPQGLVAVTPVINPLRSFNVIV